MKSLTKTEEQIMQIVWQLGPCFVKDIIEHLPSPKPPYNTVSSVVRILERKGFVDHKAYGKTHEYFPIVEKEEYSKDALKGLINNYFEGSIGNVVSAFTKEEKLSKAEVEALKEILKKQGGRK